MPKICYFIEEISKFSKSWCCNLQTPVWIWRLSIDPSTDRVAFYFEIRGYLTVLYLGMNKIPKSEERPTP